MSNEAAVLLVLVLVALLLGAVQSFERVGAGPADVLTFQWAAELYK